MPIWVVPYQLKIMNLRLIGDWRGVFWQTLTMQRYRIRRRISQLRFLDSALLQPVCEVGRRRIVALRDELLGGPVGKQRLDFRTVLVQLAFAGAFRSSDRQAGSPSRAKGFLRPLGDQPRSISVAIVNTIAGSVGINGSKVTYESRKNMILYIFADLARPVLEGVSGT